jgi:RNA polymerase I-specific transcription initiation factor RRN3
MPWTVLDNATVKSYTIFIGMLLSARPEYLSFVLAMIAQGFTYREHFPSQPLVLPITYFDLRIKFATRHYLTRIIKGPRHTQANIRPFT